MKKLLCAVILLLLTLTGCEIERSDTAVKIIVTKTPWAVIVNNGILVSPGDDAVFQLQLADGFSLTGTDFPGDVQIDQEGTDAVLTLKNVHYPTRVTLELSQESYVLRYDPNGGQGQPFTAVQSRKSHLRPNTANANAPFSKEGCTLLGWNTQVDGSGTAVGLGSRITVGAEGITLYAQWAEWTAVSFFDWESTDEGAVITGCRYPGDLLVIPEELEGIPVIRLACGAFAECPAKTVIFPKQLRTAEENCFSEQVQELYLFDSIEEISDSAVPNLQTLHINAAEPPAGAARYKESCYADKLDLLILSQDRNRVVFYGGCSMWYNLDINRYFSLLGDTWYPVDLALNGTVNSELQLQMLLPYLHEGDIFFHTPELSSDMQMLRTVEMGSNEARLWCGIEYNYDLLAAADLRQVTGELDSLCKYLSGKKEETSYEARYLDSKGRSYLGSYGEIPFSRYTPEGNESGDTVTLNRELITQESVRRLGGWYERLQKEGVSVFVSYACLNLDALADEERNNVHEVDDAFREAVEHMPGVTLLSDLMHFVFHNGYFYDTNYHLLSDGAYSCTNVWVKALKAELTGK